MSVHSIPRLALISIALILFLLVIPLCISGISTVAYRNSSSLSLIKTIKTGPHSHPQGIAYDTQDQKIFVVEQGGASAPIGNVSVISTISNKITNTIQLGYRSDPFEVAYDPINDELYVTALNALYVISGSSEKVLITIPIDCFGGIAVDTFKNNVYVIRGENLTIISGRTNKIIGTINTARLGDALTQLTYDQGNKLVYATGWAAFTYSFSTATNKLMNKISIGLSEGYSIVYDSINRNLYVGFDGYSSIAVISGASNKLLTTINNVTSTNGQTIAFEMDNGNVYAACCGTLYAISGSKNTVVGTLGLNLQSSEIGIAYDHSNKMLYVSDDQNFVYVVKP